MLLRAGQNSVKERSLLKVAGQKHMTSIQILSHQLLSLKIQSCRLCGLHKRALIWMACYLWKNGYICCDSMLFVFEILKKIILRKIFTFESIELVKIFQLQKLWSNHLIAQVCPGISEISIFFLIFKIYLLKFR